MTWLVFRILDQLDIAKQPFRSRYAHTPVHIEQSEGTMYTGASSHILVMFVCRTVTQQTTVWSPGPYAGGGEGGAHPLAGQII